MRKPIVKSASKVLMCVQILFRITAIIIIIVPLYVTVPGKRAHLRFREGSAHSK